MVLFSPPLHSLSFHPPTEYDKFSRWINSSMSFQGGIPASKALWAITPLAQRKTFHAFKISTVLKKKTLNSFFIIMQLIPVTLSAGVNYSNPLCRFTSVGAVSIWGHIKLQRVVFSIHSLQRDKHTPFECNYIHFQENFTAGTQTQPNTHTPAQGELFAQSSDLSALWRGEKWEKWGLF